MARSGSTARISAAIRRGVGKRRTAKPRSSSPSSRNSKPPAAPTSSSSSARTSAARLLGRTIVSGFNNKKILPDASCAPRLALLQLRGCIFVPKARVKHRGSATPGTTFHPWIVWLITRNQVLMIPKNYPLFLLFRLAPRLFVFQVLWLGLAITNRAFVPLRWGLLESLFLVPRYLPRSAIFSRRGC